MRRNMSGVILIQSICLNVDPGVVSLCTIDLQKVGLFSLIVTTYTQVEDNTCTVVSQNNETLTLLFVSICKFAIFISVFCFRISLREIVFLLILALKRLLRENIVVNLWIKCLFSFEHLVLKWPCMEEDFVGPPGLRNWFLPNISITYTVWYFSHPLAYGTVHVVSHLIALGLFWISRY